jgi:hypothetical protein
MTRNSTELLWSNARCAAGEVMAIQEQLREIERALGLAYPPSFVSGVEEFSALSTTEGFRRVFSDTRLLLSLDEITAARESIPKALIPFMRQEQPSGPDIYAIDLDSKCQEFQVVVWSDHAVVMTWESFPVFVQWVREQIEKHDHAA